MIDYPQTPQKNADWFNNFFSNIPTKIEQKIVPTDKHHRKYLVNPCNNLFFLRPSTEQEVEFLLKRLKNNKATGPHSIPTKILKSFPKTLSKPLILMI